MYTDDVNSWPKMCHMEASKEILLSTSKELGSEPVLEDTKYLLMFHSQNAGQSPSFRTTSRSSENVTKLNIY
jgi:hypothetical protein